jgi:methyltransferase (TIGR00027 family)
MLKSLKRVTYPVIDLEKAKQWYMGILKAPPVFEAPVAVIFTIGECSLSLVKSDQPSADTNTVFNIYWSVDNIESSYEELLTAGAKPCAPIRSLLNVKTAMVMDPFGNRIGITSMVQNSTESSVENKPSETALNVAICRAIAAREERTEIKGPDSMAELFLPEEVKKHFQNAASIKSVIERGISSALYAYIIARTAFFDEVVKKALEKGIPQIVFLGAGYDTRAYRFRQLIKNTRIFEMDIQSTQQRKLKLLADAGISIPEQLSFVTINFKTEKIGTALEKKGYNRSFQTLFIWEGVSYYLAEEAINEALQFVRDCSASGSAICFDYMTEKMESVHAGEPFRFWIAPDKIKAFFAERGLTVKEYLDNNEMEKRYLTLKDGTLAEKVMARFALVRAER